MTGSTVDFRLPRLDAEVAQGIREQALARGISRDEVVVALWRIRQAIVDTIEEDEQRQQTSGLDHAELVALLGRFGLPLTVRLG